MAHVLNVAVPGFDDHARMVAVKDRPAMPDGSACTSSIYTPSYVLKAMGLSDDEANGCVRISWCHLTPEVDWGAVAARIRRLL